MGQRVHALIDGAASYQLLDFRLSTANPKACQTNFDFHSHLLTPGKACAKVCQQPSDGKLQIVLHQGKEIHHAHDSASLQSASYNIEKV